MPTLAVSASTSGTGKKARSAMNSETVKPIPAKAPTPNRCRRVMSSGRVPSRSRMAAQLAPTTPSGLPTTSPTATPQATVLSTAVFSAAASSGTPALASAKMGTTT